MSIFMHPLPRARSLRQRPGDVRPGDVVMKEFFDRLPPWALNTSRVLAVLTLPIAVIAAVFAVAAFVGTWGLDHDIFYMRTEAR